MGSEMCIRDSLRRFRTLVHLRVPGLVGQRVLRDPGRAAGRERMCILLESMVTLCEALRPFVLPAGLRVDVLRPHLLQAPRECFYVTASRKPGGRHGF